jgi:hypothetical protein
VKPRLDENNVPWCSGPACEFFKKNPGEWGRCSHQSTAGLTIAATSMCYPVVAELVKGQPSSVSVTPALVEHIKTWLGEEGLKFFAECKRDHGTVSPVLRVALEPDRDGFPRSMPHPVHFREGMQVRNQMRQHGDCANWTAHDFDNKWSEVVEKCLD